MSLSKLSAKQKTILIAVVVTALSLALIGYAVASYGIRSPDSDTLIVNPVPTPTPTPSPSPTPVPQASLSKVTFSVAPLTVGESTRLSTTLSDAYAGLLVDFYNQHGTVVGSAYTDATGTASINIAPAIGSWVYHANTVHP